MKMSADPPSALPLVAMYGDSTTLGTTWSKARDYYTAAKNEPAMVQAGLPKAAVENHGVGGINCYDLLNGQRGVTRNWWEEMAASKADIVTINVGLNDEFFGMAEKDYVDGLNVLIRIAQAQKKIVAIETPHPTVTEQGRLQSFAQAAFGAALGNNAYIIDQFTYVSRLFDWRNHEPDGAHPDEEMYAFKATIAVSVLAPIVEGLGARSIA
jgi:acyl-CoA thioesterase-1